MTDVPGDVTIAELWRVQVAQQKAFTDLAAEVRALPSQMIDELDKRMLERSEVQRRESELKMGGLEARVRLLERALWGVIAFVFVQFGTLLFSLIDKK